MARKIIDLRSDTVTKPTPEMREAMARACLLYTSGLKVPLVVEIDVGASWYDV